MLSTNNFGEPGRKPKGELMKYVVLKSTVISGNRVRVGDVVDIDLTEAASLIFLGRIQKVEERQVETVDRSIGLTDESKPKRRGRPRSK